MSLFPVSPSLSIITCYFILEDGPRLGTLPPHTVSLLPGDISAPVTRLTKSSQRELLAHKFYHIGRSFLTESTDDGSKAGDAIQWLQRAFTIVDQLEDTPTPGIPGLKVCPAIFERYPLR